MQQNSRQKQRIIYNDYILAHQNPPYKLPSSHQRCMSSGSIYYQNSFIRKKLTVTSRDNSKSDLKGDYLMSQNNNSLHCTNRTKIQNLGYDKGIYPAQPYLSNRSSLPESLNNSSIQRGKLKRTLSPSAMTPTKTLKLKKSLVKDPHQNIGVGIQSTDRSLSNRKYQSYTTSPNKITIDRNYKQFQATQTKPTNIQESLRIIQSYKKQITSLFNIKIMQFNSKLNYQVETIKSLKEKLQENQSMLKEKQLFIQKLKASRFRTVNLHQLAPLNRQDYLLKRVKDLQIKNQLLYDTESLLKLSQEQINTKLQFITVFLVNQLHSKIQRIKLAMSQFIKSKSNLVLSLGESISYLNNKLIGRTQVIKQTLCQLKQKVKQAQDSWSFKQTKDTTNRDKSLNSDILENNMFSNRGNKQTKQITSISIQKQETIINRDKGPDLLNQSLISYDQQSLRNRNNLRNIHFEDNFNQMEDGSIINGKDESSRLTDDFYYPSSKNVPSRKVSANLSSIDMKQVTAIHIKQVSPIHRKQVSGTQSPRSIFGRKQSLKQQSLTTLKMTMQYSTVPHTTSQNSIRISNQAINNKIESIKQLISDKQASSCQQIQKGQLRCFIDKSGYLKYTDSKTFVFDKKGNLISCTEGQFWFLTTKGYIYVKSQEDQSITMSFIQFDQ